MAGSTFGQLFRVTTAGESHGPGNVCIVDGCPPGLELSVDDLIPDLQRRKPGQSRIVTPAQGRRRAGDPLRCLRGQRQPARPSPSSSATRTSAAKDYGDIKDKYRPGHADFTFDAKFGFRDYRGGGAQLGPRDDSVRVAAAAIAKKLLRTPRTASTDRSAMVDQVGDLTAGQGPTPRPSPSIRSRPIDVRCPDPAMAAAKMEQLITDVRKQQDSHRRRGKRRGSRRACPPAGASRSSTSSGPTWARRCSACPRSPA